MGLALAPGLISGQTVSTKDILVAGTASPTYGLGCDGRYADNTQGVFSCQTLTEGGQTFIRMEYLGGSNKNGSPASWGALFITVGGDPRDPPRPSEDFSAFPAVILDVRGKSGGEKPLWGFKTNKD